jgi:hypothetical protein
MYVGIGTAIKAQDWVNGSPAFGFALGAVLVAVLLSRLHFRVGTA